MTKKKELIKEWLYKKQLNGKYKVTEYKENPAGGYKKRTIHKDLPLAVAEQVVMMLERKMRYDIRQLLQNQGILKR